MTSKIIEINGINLIRRNRREKLNRLALATFVASVTGIAYLIFLAH
jgi:hypothetical protein